MATISKANRDRITILIHQSSDKAVVDYCRQLGFKEVVKLPPRPVDLAGARLLNLPFRGGDSWLYCESPDARLLNTNDCAISTGYKAAQIRRRIGAVDILLTKFSYASWVGNPDQGKLRSFTAKQKLNAMKLQAEFFLPDIVVPIASKIVFCHEENCYLNDHINTPGDASAAIHAAHARPVVLYPGDCYEVGEPWDSADAIHAYDEDVALARRRVLAGTSYLERTKEVPESRLLAAAELYRDKHGRPESKDRCAIFLWDYGVSYHVFGNGRLERGDCDRLYCDIEMTAETLLWCFEHPEHADSVRLSGRIRRSAFGNYRAFLACFAARELDNNP